jgi:hypothetical protein
VRRSLFWLREEDDYVTVCVGNGKEMKEEKKRMSDGEEE